MNQYRIAIGENLRSAIHLCPPLYKLCLETVRRYGKIYFKVIDAKGKYANKLKALKNTKEGKACFIIGNGPSLRAEDLDKIHESSYDSFASNRIFKIFDKTLWRPTYYSAVDWKGVDEKDANQLDVQYLFFSDYYWRKHKITNPNSLVFYGYRLSDPKLSTFRFSEDITQQIYMKGSVTYTNFQIAMYMGYHKIYLLGMDNSYAYVLGRDGKKVKNEGVETSHFYTDAVPEHIYSESEAMDNCFIAAKQYADRHGVEIYNATRGGKLEVFERVDFDELMK